MKCPVCGGAIVYEAKLGPYPARLKCLMCGRDYKQNKNGGNKMENQTTKKCRVCGKELPATKEYFPTCGEGKYLEGRCKECKKKYNREIYLKRVNAKTGKKKIRQHKLLKEYPNSNWKEKALTELENQILKLQHAIEVIREIPV